MEIQNQIGKMSEKHFNISLSKKDFLRLYRPKNNNCASGIELDIGQDEMLVLSNKNWGSWINRKFKNRQKVIISKIN